MADRNGERPERDKPEEASDAPEKLAASIGKPAGVAQSDDQRPKEIGGPKGPEPTRYGDWEKGGRCSDF